MERKGAFNVCKVFVAFDGEKKFWEDLNKEERILQVQNLQKKFAEELGYKIIDFSKETNKGESV